MNTIIDSITYIFKEKGWETKVGVILLALLIAYFISGIISVVFQLPIEITKSIMEEAGRDLPMLEGLSSLTSTMTSFVMWPVNLYITGYLIGVVLNIVHKKENVLVEHKDVLGTIIKGLKLSITTMIVTLPTTIAGLILLGFVALGAILLVNANQGGLLLGSLVVLFTFIVAMLLFVLNSVLSYVAGYIYIKTGSFRKALVLKTIIDTLKTHERPLLKLFVHLLALSFVQTFAIIIALILICISFFTIPVVIVVGYFAKAYIIGKYYLMMSNFEK